MPRVFPVGRDLDFEVEVVLVVLRLTGKVGIRDLFRIPLLCMSCIDVCLLPFVALGVVFFGV